MILADIRVGTRMMLSWCGRSICTSQHWWLAGAQRLLAFLKDSPTYCEMPLQGRDLVPPVRFVGKFCSRTFCGFRGNIPRQPVRNPAVADVHEPVDVGFISGRNRVQHQLIFPALDRRVFFALNFWKAPTVLGQGGHQHPPHLLYFSPVASSLPGGGGHQFHQPIIEAQYHPPPAVQDGLAGNRVPVTVPKQPLRRTRRVADSVPGEVSVQVFRSSLGGLGEVQFAKTMFGPFVLKGLVVDQY